MFLRIGTNLRNRPSERYRYKFHRDCAFSYLVQGSASVLQQYNGSVVNALQDLFPEVEFDATKFANVTSTYCLAINALILAFEGGYWQDVANMRQLFVGFAEQQGFDPLLPKNWYHINPDLVLAQKVCY